MKTSKWTAKDMAEIALIAAIYVALTLTPPLNAMSFGAIQFRLSEMLNFLAFYNRKYIFAVTIGCMISNLIGFGVIDLFVGGFSTLIFVTVGVILFEKYKKDYLFGGLFNKAFFYFSFFFAATMFTIALELKVLYDLPFFLTWLTTATGELVSLLVGSLVIERVAKRLSL
ncbi:queuosine transporter QueT [Streptococcus suis]|uniref:QueT transporter family protein n=1 Tax=Streptococcus suivaginalis TaxID=3028082 RepID=A0AA96VEY0_9STRE|nr:QueT transporter family protein [Streptococcus sp. 29896]MCK4027834.1 queuosine transporter QueT [Streptococcus suis]WNY47623.1 QueT transporter family protein [Streptococcus sp. 29896]